MEREMERERGDTQDLQRSRTAEDHTGRSSHQRQNRALRRLPRLPLTPPPRAHTHKRSATVSRGTDSTFLSFLFTGNYPDSSVGTAKKKKNPLIG